MNENLKTTIVQKLGNMTDETGRQLLDYIEFLESRFNRSSRERSTLERLAENFEGTLRSNPLGEAAIKGTGGIIDAAGSVARSFAAAGQAVLDELQGAVGERKEKPPAAKESHDQPEADGTTAEKPAKPTAAKASGAAAGTGDAGGDSTSP